MEQDNKTQGSAPESTLRKELSQCGIDIQPRHEVAISAKHNWIKILFRKWLRKRVFLYCGASYQEAEVVFNWIYDAPIWEWRIRLFCIQCKSKEEAAEKLLRFLNE